MPFSPSEPFLDVVEWDDRSVARIGGCNSLTDANIEPLNRQLAAFLAGREGRHLVLDLCEIEFVSSAGVAAFLGLNRRVKANHGQLTLVNARPEIRKVFTVTRLDRVVDIRTGSDPSLPPA